MDDPGQHVAVLHRCLIGDLQDQRKFAPASETMSVHIGARHDTITIAAVRSFRTWT